MTLPSAEREPPQSLHLDLNLPSARSSHPPQPTSIYRSHCGVRSSTSIDLFPPSSVSLGGTSPGDAARALVPYTRRAGRGRADDSTATDTPSARHVQTSGGPATGADLGPSAWRPPATRLGHHRTSCLHRRQWDDQDTMHGFLTGPRSGRSPTSCGSSSDLVPLYHDAGPLRVVGPGLL